jgi:hypothetical protein
MGFRAQRLSPEFVQYGGSIHGTNTIRPARGSNQIDTLPWECYKGNVKTEPHDMNSEIIYGLKSSKTFEQALENLDRTVKENK